MAMSSYTVLKRGGRLFAPGIYGAEVDITDYAPAYSLIRCEFEPGVRVEDLMLFVSRNTDFWEQVFGFDVKRTVSTFLNKVAVHNNSLDYISVDYYMGEEDDFLVGLVSPACDVVRRDGSRTLLRAVAPEYLVRMRVVLGSLLTEGLSYEKATFGLAAVLRSIFIELQDSEIEPVDEFVMRAKVADS